MRKNLPIGMLEPLSGRIKAPLHKEGWQKSLIFVWGIEG